MKLPIRIIDYETLEPIKGFMNNADAFDACVNHITHVDIVIAYGKGIGIIDEVIAMGFSEFIDVVKYYRVQHEHRIMESEL